MAELLAAAAIATTTAGALGMLLSGHFWPLLAGAGIAATLLGIAVGSE